METADAMAEETFLPILDLSLVDGGASGGGDAKAFAAALHDAFVHSGFCYITNHGVPDAVIEATRAKALEFFRLPIEEKLKVSPKEAVRGFNAIGRTKMQYAEAPDYKEFYQIGLELPADDPAVLAGEAMRGPNQWPDLPGFREAFEAYYREIGRCGQRLLRGVALALGVADDFFVGKYAKPLQRTQAVYYPPHPEDHEGELFGVAPHTDYGCITLLWQDDVGGLEVLDRQGRWIDAPPIPGTLVINIGDLLQRWSNNRYFSNQHRVTNRSGRERLSIATFYDPDYSAMVDPRDLNLAPGEDALHAPISAGDYIMGRINRSQKHNAQAEAFNS
ncbi:isopenicillin N synthase family dioxygenase [Novosphingobium nitrogenifigens]|nr:2OG-Fe(II) oxygenase family protein [Novosphingobium nitrogenifigens]